MATSPPPPVLRLDPAAGTVLGVDAGHRRMRVALADHASRVVAERHAELHVDRFALPAAASAVGVTAGVLGGRADVLDAQPGFTFDRTTTGGDSR